MLLIVDGANLTMRAIHASANVVLSGGDQLNTAPLTIFANSLGKIVRDTEPRKAIVAWDSPEKGFRWTAYPQYKANRKTTLANIDKDRHFQMNHLWLEYAGISQITMPKMEADDVIAAVWRGADDEVSIASNDHDFLQLLGPNPHGHETTLLRMSGGGAGTDWWDAARLQDEHGFAPQHYVEQAALCGDSSDNIPGLKGIGPKKALKLLREHSWDAERATQAVDPSQVDRIVLYRDIMDLRDGPDVLPSTGVTDFVEPGVFGWENFSEWMLSYGMQSLVDKIATKTFWRPERLIMPELSLP